DRWQYPSRIIKVDWLIRSAYGSSMSPERAALRSNPSRWLFLIHQVPAKPDYLRVKVRRRLAQLGAVALKNSVYVLPASPEGRSRLGELAREILRLGGEALVHASTSSSQRRGRPATIRAGSRTASHAVRPRGRA